MYTINITKTGKSIEVDYDNLPDHVKSYIVEYGLKQKFNDCHSQITAKSHPDVKERDSLVTEKIEELYEALKAGDLALRRSSSGLSAKQRMELSILCDVVKSHPEIRTVAKAKELIETSGVEKVMKAFAKAKGQSVKDFEAWISEEADKRLLPDVNVSKVDLSSLL